MSIGQMIFMKGLKAVALSQDGKFVFAVSWDKVARKRHPNSEVPLVQQVRRSTSDRTTFINELTMMFIMTKA